MANHASTHQDWRADERTIALLRHLWRGGWGHLWRKQGLSYWINLQELAHALARLGDQWAADTYFGVHPTSAPKSAYERARADDIAAANCVFADFDTGGQDPQALLARIEALRPAPSVIIASGGGYHAYWLLDESISLADEAMRRIWAEVQRWWVRHVGADPAACDLARLLRVPGTRNAKYDPPRPVQFVRCDLSALHNPDAFFLAAFEARARYEQEQEQAATQGEQPERAPTNGSAGESPIEQYNRQTNIRDALREFGYHVDGRYFTRPGKDPRQGISGTIDDAHNRAYTFSVNDPAYDSANTSPSGAGCTLRPFDLLCRLRFGGDARAAARWLVESGRVSAGRSATSGAPASTTPASSATNANGSAADGGPQKVDDAELIGFDPDDAGNGDALAYALGERYLYSDRMGWLRWTGTHYERENAEKLLEADAVEVLRKRRAAAVQASKESVVQASKPSMQRVRAAIQRLAGLRAAPVSSFDNQPHLLNARNCVIDLRSGAILAHETSFRFTVCISAEYDPEADYSAWVSWLRQTVKGGDEVVQWLQTWLGYGITGSTSLEQLLYIYGPTRSGKGTLTETLLALMGGLAKTADFSSFTKRDDHQNFDLAALRGARLVVAGEGTRAGELNAAKIKLLTGGDEVSCAYKHRDIFTYRPQYKLILVSNHKLNVDVDDDAAWARVRVLEFPHSHLGREDIGLKERMKRPDNLRAVLAWLVEGARRFYAYADAGKAIPTPDVVNASTRDHRETLDYVGQWMAENLERAGEGMTTAKDCWNNYKVWCEENGVLNPRGIRAFKAALEKRGVTFERTNTTRNVMRGWRLKA